MRKKSLICILVLCMVMLFSGCGDINPHVIEIDGITYDLTGDFQDVVGDMVEDDVIVANMYNLRYYDEDGCFTKSGGDNKLLLNEESLPVCFVDQRLTTTLNSEIVVSKYYLKDVFETAHGINEDSKKSAIKSLDDFRKYKGLINSNNKSYLCMYMDDKIIDLDKYEDKLEEIINEMGTNELIDWKKIIKEFFPDITARPEICPILVTSYNVEPFQNENDINDNFGKNYFWDVQLLIGLAAQDAASMLKDGDIDSYSLIIYDIEDDYNSVYYYIYTYDDDWDNKKFMPKE